MNKNNKIDKLFQNLKDKEYDMNENNKINKLFQSSKDEIHNINKNNKIDKLFQSSKDEIIHNINENNKIDKLLQSSKDEIIHYNNENQPNYISYIKNYLLNKPYYVAHLVDNSVPAVSTKQIQVNYDKPTTLNTNGRNGIISLSFFLNQEWWRTTFEQDIKIGNNILDTYISEKTTVISFLNICCYPSTKISIENFNPPFNTDNYIKIFQDNLLKIYNYITYDLYVRIYGKNGSTKDIRLNNKSLNYYTGYNSLFFSFTPNVVILPNISYKYIIKLSIQLIPDITWLTPTPTSSIISITPTTTSATPFIAPITPTSSIAPITQTITKNLETNRILLSRIINKLTAEFQIKIDATEID